jgi:hypothetical protein
MGKYDSYFVTQDKTDLTLPAFRHKIPENIASRIVYLDNDVVPGAFYTECLWFWPRQVPQQQSTDPGVKPHSHQFDEIIAFFGTNFDDPHDLCGEIELWIEDEQYIMNKSFMAFIPAGVTHCPLRIRRIDKPIFHFTAGPGRLYA